MQNANFTEKKKVVTRTASGHLFQQLDDLRGFLFITLLAGQSPTLHA
jgi:hypothetical protein